LIAEYTFKCRMVGQKCERNITEITTPGHAGKIGKVSLAIGNPYLEGNWKRVTVRFY